MKKIFAILASVFIAIATWAQSPNIMSYQAVIRDASDALVINQIVAMQISILQGELDGSSVYVETQMPNTNDNGLLSIKIGSGTILLGEFSDIDWSEGPYFIKTEIDPEGSTNYNITGTSQLLSVPFAFHSTTAESISGEINEVDPFFTESVSSSITSEDTTRWNSRSAELIESDPIFAQSVSSAITGEDTTRWNSNSTEAFVDVLLEIMENNNITITDFNSDKQIETEGGIFNFTDNSKLAASTWYWEFGDGNTSTLQNPSHAYNLAGTYTVSLTISKNGISKKATKPDYLIVNPDINGVTDYDGNTYSAIIIGSQIWMRENLKATHYSDGTAISLVMDETEWSNLGNNDTDKAYSYYDNDENSEYGALYTWAAAMNGSTSSSSNPSGVQGVCPNGWHLPSFDEWTELITYLGGWSSGVGGKMKETGLTHWNSPNTGATNESGFTALAGGNRLPNGEFDQLGITSIWWSTLEEINSQSYHIYLGYNGDYVAGGDVGSMKSSGLSVRCIKD